MDPCVLFTMDTTLRYTLLSIICMAICVDDCALNATALYALLAQEDAESMWKLGRVDLLNYRACGEYGFRYPCSSAYLHDIVEA